MSLGLRWPGRRNYTKPSGPAKAEPELDPNFLVGKANAFFSPFFFFFFLKNAKIRGGGRPEKEKALSKDVLHGKGREKWCQESWTGSSGCHQDWKSGQIPTSGSCKSEQLPLPTTIWRAAVSVLVSVGSTAVGHYTTEKVHAAQSRNIYHCIPYVNI